MFNHLNLTCNKCDNTFTTSIDKIIKTQGQIDCPVCKNLLMSLNLLNFAKSQQHTNGTFHWLLDELSQERHINQGKRWQVQIVE